MNIILHIGSDKCGSTAIQRTLARNRQTLLERGIAYCDYGQLAGEDGWYRREGATHLVNPDRLRAFLDKAERDGISQMIFSHEGWHTLPAQDIELIRAALSDHDLQIVFYLREQADYASSAYLQRAKTGFDTKELFEVYHGRKKVAIIPDYLETLTRWTEVFPTTRLSLRVFDRSLLFKGDAVLDFFHTIDVSIEGISLDPSPINTSITLEVAEALELLHSLGLTNWDDGSLVMGVGERLGKSRVILSPHQVFTTRARWFFTNWKIARRFCGRNLLFPFKPIRRLPYDPHAVKNLILEVGKQMPYLLLLAEGEYPALSKFNEFKAQDFRASENGIEIKQGRSMLRIRIGNWHTPEFYAFAKLEMIFVPTMNDIIVELGSQRKTTKNGSVSFEIDFTETPILETIEIQFESPEPETLEIFRLEIY
ncbi:MAG: hypothetical protein AAGA96_19655 [Verrucomicrobiota bacterium]